MEPERTCRGHRPDTAYLAIYQSLIANRLWMVELLNTVSINNGGQIQSCQKPNRHCRQPRNISGSHSAHSALWGLQAVHLMQIEVPTRKPILNEDLRPALLPYT